MNVFAIFCYAMPYIFCGSFSFIKKSEPQNIFCGSHMGKMQRCILDFAAGKRKNASRIWEY